MKKNLLFFLAMAAVLLISCSDSDKFNANSESKIEFDVYYQLFKYQNKPYLYAYADISPRNGEEDDYYYYWVMDGVQQCYNCHGEHKCYNCRDIEKNISYGEHFLEFILIDSFGDTLSDGGIIQVDEPLKITMLSPVDEYNIAKADTIEFQYKISGIDTWEENPQTVVYISTDEDVWENGKPIQDNFLLPPFDEQAYYWAVKAFTKQDTTYSEIRSVWIKK